MHSAATCNAANAQGNIMAIFGTAYKIAVKYVYDAWANRKGYNKTDKKRFPSNGSDPPSVNLLKNRLFLTLKAVFTLWKKERNFFRAVRRSHCLTETAYL